MNYVYLLVALFLSVADLAGAEVTPASRITPATDVSVTSAATVVSAANPFRLSISCTNTSSGVNVRWGSSAVTATKGQRLIASGSIEIRNTAAIYMISEGATVTVSCTEELR